MQLVSLEDAIFSSKFIRRTALTALALLAMLVIGNIIFCIILPRSPMMFRFQFDVDQEGNWASWFNSTLDLAAGVTAIIVAWLAQRQRTQHERPFSMHWLLLGGILVYLGMDDAAQLHEHTYGPFKLLSSYLARWLPGMARIGWYIWLPVLGIPSIIILLYAARAVYRDIRSHRLAKWLFIAALALLLSNPVTEYMQAKLTEPTTPGGAPQFAEQLYQSNRPAWLAVQVIDLVQESTEITAAVCLWVAFLLIGQDLVIRQKEKVDSLRGPC